MPDIIGLIKEVLNDNNPFVQLFRHASENINGDNQEDVKVILLGSRDSDGRVYNLPSSSEVAALIVGNS